MCQEPFPYKRLETVPLGRYRIELGELSTEDGPSPYSIVRMRPFSCCVASYRGSLAMVRQYRYSVDSWQLELPAGGIEAGETPARAAARELREEAGLVAGDLVDLGTVYPSVGSTDEECHLFATVCEPQMVPRALDRGEKTELVLYTREVVERMMDEGTIVYPELYVAWRRLEHRGLLDELFPRRDEEGGA